MVTLRIPDDPERPVHDRIAAAVRRAIADRALEVGSRLPTARDLAGSLDVHPNTVLRAYRTLRDEGVIELRRGRGATVVAHGGDELAGIGALVDELVRSAAVRGVGRDELARWVATGRPPTQPGGPR